VFWGGENPLNDVSAGAWSNLCLHSPCIGDFHNEQQNLRAGARMNYRVESKIAKLTQAKIVTFLIFSWSHSVLKAFNETNFPFIILLTSKICQETNC